MRDEATSDRKFGDSKAMGSMLCCNHNSAKKSRNDRSASNYEELRPISTVKDQSRAYIQHYYGVDSRTSKLVRFTLDGLHMRPRRRKRLEDARNRHARQMLELKELLLPSSFASSD